MIVGTVTDVQAAESHICFVRLSRHAIIVRNVLCAYEVDVRHAGIRVCGSAASHPIGDTVSQNAACRDADIDLELLEWSQLFVRRVQPGSVAEQR